MPETGTTTEFTWWANENTGAITCSAHAGAELSSNIRAYPKRVEHITPFGTYQKMGTFEQTLIVDLMPSVTRLEDMCDEPHDDDGAPR